MQLHPLTRLLAPISLCLACASGAVPVRPMGGSLPSTGPAARTRSAVMVALTAEGHVLTNERPGAVDARLVVGRGSADVTIEYDGDGFRVVLRESYGLGQHVDEATGERVIDRRYERIVDRLVARVRAVSQYGPAPARVLVLTAGQRTQSATEVAVARGLRDMRFSVVSASPGSIVAERRTHGQGLVRLRVEFGAGRLTITLAGADASFIDEQGRVFADRRLARVFAQVEHAIAEAAEDVEEEQVAREVAVARASAPQVAVGGGGRRAVGGTTCPAIVLAHGHSQFDTNNCVPRVDLLCVDTVLSLGHRPWDVRHCQDVDGVCAERELLAGRDPFFVKGRCSRR